MIGQLPDDFLRISLPEVNPETVPSVQGEQNVDSIPQQTPYQPFGSAVNFFLFF